LTRLVNRLAAEANEPSCLGCIQNNNSIQAYFDIFIILNSFPDHFYGLNKSFLSNLIECEHVVRHWQDCSNVLDASDMCRSQEKDSLLSIK
jgi:hypothetical protein